MPIPTLPNSTTVTFSTPPSDEFDPNEGHAVTATVDTPVDAHMNPTDSRPVTQTPQLPEGNPGLIGLPLTIVGAMGLGFTNTGIVDSASAAIPIVMSATSIGLLLATIWAAALRQNVNAALYSVFFGFYGSYAILSLGLGNDWFGIDPDQVTTTSAMWIGSWLVTITILTLLVIRLPWSFPFLLTIVDLALVCLLVGTLTASSVATQLGGWLVFLFVAVAIYFYVAAMWEETGGSPLPMGRPLIS